MQSARERMGAINLLVNCAGGFIWATTQPKDAKVTWTSTAP